MQQTSDGGYIILGSTSSYGAGDSDIWLIKTDASGDTLWTLTFGGNKDDWGSSVQQTTDGGYIILGSTSSYNEGSYDSDVWLIKTDSFGDTLWTRTFGGSMDDRGSSLQQTSDGGYIITGSTSSYGAGDSDVWLIKTDSFGDTLWTRTFGGSEGDRGSSLQQTSDGGYIITGSYGVGSYKSDVWLIKTDASGDTLWTRTFGGINGGNSMDQTSDGGYIITGYTQSYGAGYFDVRLIKTDASGDTLWIKTAAEGSLFPQGSSVQQTHDGGYIITGVTMSRSRVYSSAWLIKTDVSGDILWNKTFGGIHPGNGTFVKQTADGGYIITGKKGSISELRQLLPGRGGGDTNVWLVRVAADMPHKGNRIQED